MCNITKSWNLQIPHGTDILDNSYNLEYIGSDQLGREIHGGSAALGLKISRESMEGPMATSTHLLSGGERDRVSATDIVAVLDNSNPISSPIFDRVNKMILKVRKEVTKAQRKSEQVAFVRIDKNSIAELQIILTALTELTSTTEEVSRQPEPVAGKGTSATQRGVDFGELLTPEEGRKRLLAYSSRTPLEEWAGESVGAVELQRRLKIARSTLQEWREANVVVGLQKGVRNFVFPLAQFDDDGRPTPGLDEIVDLAGTPRAAWLWLVEPRSENRPTYLDRLKHGDRLGVVNEARENFE